MNLMFLFYFGCIGSRLLLVYLFYKLYLFQRDWLLYLLSAIFFIMGFGMLLIMLFNLRPNKGAFNNTIWWGSYRPIHILLYLSMSYFFLKREINYPWKLFLLDTMISGALFTYHRINTKTHQRW